MNLARLCPLSSPKQLFLQKYLAEQSKKSALESGKKDVVQVETSACIPLRRLEPNGAEKENN